MKKRKDSFWGLHFDFHARPENGVQGLSLNEDNIREICRSLKPDFIQIDCKGHPGWTSYPSRLGNAMPEFSQNTLKLWRQVTKDEGVALYMHYSGVFDKKYCSEHPEQGVLMANGVYSKDATKLNGSYSDDLLIPQLLELAGEYEVDGAWIDGDCWMAFADFSSETLSSFEKETGIDLEGKLPATAEDAYYYEYREYNRELFKRYMRHYVDTVHEKYPDFEICSNWAFSDHMPEKVSVNVDFLSGDLNPMNSFNSARYAARALAQQEGYAWDLMSWNFRNIVGGRSAYVAKHPNQLKQEAAAVIAVGGAYQNYVPQNKDGSPKMWEVKNLIGLSEFVLARKQFCHRATQVHQAALLLSTYDRKHEAKQLYSRTGYERVMGLSSLLCDVGQSLEIVCEHTLEKNINEYKMIVVPELYSGLENETIESLLTYAKGGGNLVLVGKNTCSIFAKAGAPFVCKDHLEYIGIPSDNQQNGHNNVSTNTYKPYCFTMDGNTFGAVFSPCEIIASDIKTNAFFAEKPTDDLSSLSVTVPYENGKITAIGFDIGSQYLSGTQYMHRELMKQVANSLYEPIVQIESALGRLEIVVLNKDGKTMIQLVNAGGAHADSSSATDDYIPPVLDIKLSISLPKAPEKLILHPEGTELPFAYGNNGKAIVCINRVDIHSIIEICE
ncbi:MAG: hypothetical protein IJZ93_03535 [Clostridia bacterium]|nr:hypothetical protein [Clostridia bacterium]